MGRWRNFYEIFLDVPILCLRKRGLHTIYYIENIGFLRGGRDIGGRGWLLAGWYECVELFQVEAWMLSPYFYGSCAGDVIKSWVRDRGDGSVGG